MRLISIPDHTRAKRYFQNALVRFGLWGNHVSDVDFYTIAMIRIIKKILHLYSDTTKTPQEDVEIMIELRQQQKER